MVSHEQTQILSAKEGSDKHPVAIDGRRIFHKSWANLIAKRRMISRRLMNEGIYRGRPQTILQNKVVPPPIKHRGVLEQSSTYAMRHL
ncbi:hypothetical protein CEXT_385711 [Caerostris extrusa]|uniref:Uncharacterized protein n=1 Tax=Caerostris extrusa TaxID=172846 RepID=A0AAV4WCM2_CAEEX|nr:hypothetical protein CEXT_385711 [Caerostris extrusa]